LEKRKESWGKFMFKGGSKEALLDDVEKSLRDNTNRLD